MKLPVMMKILLIVQITKLKIKRRMNTIKLKLMTLLNSWKKKREAEAKAKSEAAAQAPPVSQPSSEPKVSLLGIGGKKKKNKSEGKSGGKKRTPGEIRIQKG